MHENTNLTSRIERETRSIYQRIQNNKVDLPDGSHGWVGYDFDKSGNVVIEGRKGMYSGQLGVALYFAAMYRVYGREEYRIAAANTADFLLVGEPQDQMEVAELGGGNGLGGILYGLSLLSSLTDDRKYWERARELLHELERNRITSDDVYDVLLGTSGLLLGLLHLYERHGEESALDAAVACGEHLLDSRYDKWNYRVWDTHVTSRGKSFTTGMGHGAAGICYALYRLYGNTGQTRFRDAANEALQFEEFFFSDLKKNWKANWHSLPDYPDWWCYGRSGIGLARLGSLAHYDSDQIRKDLQRVRSGIHSDLSARDSICHGTFARVELLTEFHRNDDVDGDFIHEAGQLATKALNRKVDSGHYRVDYGGTKGIYNPVLFLGTAGVGYTFLRLLYPEQIPSILRYE